MVSRWRYFSIISQIFQKISQQQSTISQQVINSFQHMFSSLQYVLQLLNIFQAIFILNLSVCFICLFSKRVYNMLFPKSVQLGVSISSNRGPAVQGLSQARSFRARSENAVSQWCPGGVPVVSRWCPGGVLAVSRQCPGGVPVVSRR